MNDDESRQSCLTATSDSCDLVIDSRPPSKLNGEIYPEKRKADETLKNEFEPMSKQIKISNSPSPEIEDRHETINENILDQSIDSGKSSLADHNDLSVPETNIVENTNEEFNEEDGHSSDASCDNEETVPPAKQSPLKLIFKRDGQNNLTISSPNKTKFRNSPTPSSSDYSESSEDEQLKKDEPIMTVNNVKIDKNDTELVIESKTTEEKDEEIKCIAPSASTDLSNVQSSNPTPPHSSEIVCGETSNLVLTEFNKDIGNKIEDPPKIDIPETKIMDDTQNLDIARKEIMDDTQNIDIPRTIITDFPFNNYCLDRKIVKLDEMDEVDVKNNFPSSSLLQYLNNSNEQQIPKLIMEQPAQMSDYPLNLKMQSVNVTSEAALPKPIIGNNMRLAELLSRPRKIMYPHESVKDNIDLEPPDYLLQHQSTSPLNLQMPKQLLQPSVPSVLPPLPYTQYPIVPQFNQVNNNQSWNVQQREKRQIIPTFKIRKGESNEIITYFTKGYYK